MILKKLTFSKKNLNILMFLLFKGLLIIMVMLSPLIAYIVLPKNLHGDVLKTEDISVVYDNSDNSGSPSHFMPFSYSEEKIDRHKNFQFLKYVNDARIMFKKIKYEDNFDNQNFISATFLSPGIRYASQFLSQFYIPKLFNDEGMPEIQTNDDNTDIPDDFLQQSDTALKLQIPDKSTQPSENKNVPDVKLPSSDKNIPIVSVPSAEMQKPSEKKSIPDVKLPSSDKNIPVVSVPSAEMQKPSENKSIPDVKLPSSDKNIPVVSVPSAEMQKPSENKSIPDVKLPSSDKNIPVVSVPSAEMQKPSEKKNVLDAKLKSNGQNSPSVSVLKLGVLDATKEDKLVPGKLIVDLYHNHNINKLYLPFPEDIFFSRSLDNSSIKDLMQKKDYIDLVFYNIRNENFVVLSALIDLLGDTEIENDNNETPLTYAVKLGKIDSVKVLLGKGANPNVTNIDNVTLLEIAEKKGFKLILDIIKQHI